MWGFEGLLSDFFATFSHAPLLYVKGNHDGHYEERPPEGCVCIEDDIFVFRGVRILGLGGSMEYIPGADNQYTERRMERRIKKALVEVKEEQRV